MKSYRLPISAALAAVAILTAGHGRAQSLRDGLEVYWNFDEGKGNTANDSSGHDREAVPAENLFPGAVIDWSGGKFGGSVKFDRTYMLQSPFEYFGIGGDHPRTVSFWIKTTWDARNSSSLGALVGWGINAPMQRIHVKMNGGTDADGKVVQFIRTENQGGNNFGGLFPINDGVWHHIVSVFDPAVDSNQDGVFAAIGDFDHYVDGRLESKAGGVTNPVDTNINPDEGAVPLTVGGGYFPNINAARTSEARIDEFRLYSRALSVDEILALAKGKDVDGPPAIELLNEIEGAELVDAAQPLAFTVTPQGGATVSAERVALVLNGRDVSGQLEISNSGTGLRGRFVGLRKNTVYAGTIAATDGQERAYGFDFNFDTISPDNFTIEAEDFNFGGGSFFDNPVICNTPGGMTPDCYFDRVSEPGVDANDGEGDDRPTDADADFEAFLASGYRFGSGSFREEQVDTWVSGDAVRDKFSQAGDGFLDYDVERVSAGEWLNYTRTFSAGTYQVLLRVRARAAQTLALGLADNASAANQSVAPLGNFEVPVTGGKYRFVTLSDDQGQPAIVELDGRQTLRLTALEAAGDLELNYLMIFPAEKQAEPVEATLTIAVEAGEITLTWDGSGGVLQRTADLNGPWENIATDGNRHSQSAAAAAEFFRVVSP